MKRCVSHAVVAGLLGVMAFDQSAERLMAYNARLITQSEQERRYDELIRSLAVLTEMIGTPYKPGEPIPKKNQGCAYNNVDIRKQKAMTLEEIAHLTADSSPLKSRRWTLAVQEWTSMSKSFVPKLTPIPDLLTPEDKVKYKTDAERAKRNAILLAELTPEKRAIRKAEVADAAAKRALYFELWFEAKRCSVKAYQNIGVSVMCGDQAAFAEKFHKFAVDFQEFMTKNNDLSSTIKDSINKLIDDTPMLKQEYNNVISAK